METPHDSIQTVRTLFEAFSQRDAGRFVEYLDPKIEWTSAENFIYAEASPRVGIQAVVQHLFGRVLVDWDNFRMVPVEILGSGDIVIASGRFRAALRRTARPLTLSSWKYFIQGRQGGQNPDVHGYGAVPRHGHGHPVHKRVRDHPEAHLMLRVIPWSRSRCR